MGFLAVRIHSVFMAQEVSSSSSIITIKYYDNTKLKIYFLISSIYNKYDVEAVISRFYINRVPPEKLCFSPLIRNRRRRRRSTDAFVSCERPADIFSLSHVYLGRQRAPRPISLLVAETQTTCCRTLGSCHSTRLF